MPTVQETFAAMGGRFRPDKASGTSATIQYDVSGEGGGTRNAVVKDGACMVSPCPATNPNLTLSIAAQDLLNNPSGKDARQVVFVGGDIEVDGDPSLLVKLGCFVSFS